MLDQGSKEIVQGSTKMPETCAHALVQLARSRGYTCTYTQLTDTRMFIVRGAMHCMVLRGCDRINLAVSRCLLRNESDIGTGIRAVLGVAHIFDNCPGRNGAAMSRKPRKLSSIRPTQAYTLQSAERAILQNVLWLERCNARSSF